MSFFGSLCVSVSGWGRKQKCQKYCCVLSKCLLSTFGKLCICSGLASKQRLNITSFDTRLLWLWTNDLAFSSPCGMGCLSYFSIVHQLSFLLEQKGNRKSRCITLVVLSPCGMCKAKALLLNCLRFGVVLVLVMVWLCNLTYRLSPARQFGLRSLYWCIGDIHCARESP